MHQGPKIVNLLPSEIKPLLKWMAKTISRGFRTQTIHSN